MNPLAILIEGAITGAIEGVAGKTLIGRIGATAAKAIAQTATETVVKDPVLRNQVNAEPAYKSRVVVGTTIGLVGMVFVSAGHLIEMWQTGDIDIPMASAEIAAIWGASFALYGRLKSGLKPLFE